MIGVASCVCVRPILMMLLPRLRLVVQGVAQLLQRGDEHVNDFLRRGDVHRGRVAVVRRLAHVHMIVRMDRLLGAEDAAEHLDRPVRDHLVGVHVRLRARTRLPDRQREVRVELAFHNLVRGGDDGLADGRVELAEVHVGLGGGALDDAERADNRQRLLLPADAEILERALRLRAPILVGRNLDGTEGVGFDSHCGRHLAATGLFRHVKPLPCGPVVSSSYGTRRC